MGRRPRRVDHDGVAQGRDQRREPAAGAGGRHLTRVEWTAEEAAALGRGFAAFYWALVAAFAVGALLAGRGELVFAAGVAAVMLLLWQVQVWRHRGGWVLTVDADELAVETGGERRAVRRTAVADVRWKRRRTRGAAWWELQLLGPDGGRVARESIADLHRPAVVAGLAAAGWPA